MRRTPLTTTPRRRPLLPCRQLTTAAGIIIEVRGTRRAYSHQPVHYRYVARTAATAAAAARSKLIRRLTTGACERQSRTLVYGRDRGSSRPKYWGAGPSPSRPSPPLTPPPFPFPFTLFLPSLFPSPSLRSRPQVHKVVFIATYLRCDGVVNNQIKTGVLLSPRVKKSLKIGEYFAKLQARAWLSRALCASGQRTARKRRKCTR